jgi:hypothetical protein
MPVERQWGYTIEDCLGEDERSKMNNYTGFVSKYVDKIYTKANTYFEIDPRLELAVKASIAVDTLIFYIELVNEFPLDESRSRKIIDNLVDASINIFSESNHYTVMDFVATREEAAAILTDLALDGIVVSPDEAANTNFGLKTLTSGLYNHRVEKYFASKHRPVMVISSTVPMLYKNLGVEDGASDLLQEINSIFLEASADLVDLITGKSLNTSQAAKSSNCYIVTAASGSADSDLVHFYRNFRDEVLDNSHFGKLFIKNYYRFSPRFAEAIRNNGVLKTLSLLMLKSLRFLIKTFRDHPGTR